MKSGKEIYLSNHYSRICFVYFYLEHALVNKASVDRLVQFVDFVHSCPRSGPDWIEAFVNACGGKGMEPSADQCLDCLNQRQKELRKK